MDIVNCKFIYTENNGYCLTKKDFVKEGDIYVSKHLNIKIDELNYTIFTKSGYKFFYAVRDPNGFYHLKGLNKEGIESVKKGDFKQDYEPSRYLAKGTYGSVDSYPTENIVIKNYKRIDSDFIKEVGIYRLFKEFTCMPYFYDFLYDKNYREVSIVIEKGIQTLNDLKCVYDNDDTIEKTENKYKKFYETVKKIFFQIVKCLKLFNSQGIIHCDLKPTNIIIVNSKDGLKPQIIDWGLAKIDYCPVPNQIDFNIQTPAWRAPEIFANKPYNYKIDIFSLGIIYTEIYVKTKKKLEETPIMLFYKEGFLYGLLYELLHIKKKFDINTIIDFDKPLYKIIKFNLITNNEFKNQNRTYYFVKELINTKIFDEKTNIYYDKAIKAIDSLPKLDDDSEEFYDLVSHMLEFNSKFRYDYDDIILHPYFQYIKRQSYPSFPIFMNKMSKIDLSKVSQDLFAQRLARIDELSNNGDVSNDALFLTIQLYDIILERYHDKEKFGDTFEKQEKIIFKSSLILSQHLYDDIKKVIVLNGDWLINIPKMLQFFDNNIIYPSLYSYLIYYNKNIPTGDDTSNLIQLYKKPDIYMVFNDLIDMIKTNAL